MDKIVIGAKKAVNKVIYGVSKLFRNFNKRIRGVRKSKNIYPIKGRKENNFQVCYPVKLYKEKKLPIIFYFHGGGWMEFDKYYYSTFCKRLAKMGYIVCNVNYSLAPKSNLKEIIENCIEIIIKAKEYLEYTYNADSLRIILSGDSAGAHISSLIAGLASSEKLSTVFPHYSNEDLKIAQTLLFYGVYNLQSAKTSGFPSIELYLRACLQNNYDDESVNKELSPVSYISKNYPRTFIVSGEVDKLHESQSKAFYEKLKEANAEVECLFFSRDTKTGMHGFIAFDDFKANEKTRIEIERFLNVNSEG